MITRTDADNLKNKQRALRDGFGDSLGLRVHRAISWLQRAAREDDDRDAAFVFLWIAFNSAYSQDIGIAYHVSEKGRFKSFLSTLLSFDRDDRIYHLVWTHLDFADLFKSSIIFFLNLCIPAQAIIAALSPQNFKSG